MIKNTFFLPAKNLLKSIPLYDFHLHTNYSDGKNTIEEYAVKAVKQGYKAICFTDHVDFTTDWFQDYKQEILDANKKYKSLSMFCGIEVRAKDYNGKLNADPKILNEADVMVGVVHSLPSKDGKSIYNPQNLPIKEVFELEYRATMGLLKNPLVDVLGHPMSNYEKYFGEFSEEYYVKIFQEAKKNDIAIELNPAYQRNFSTFLKLALKINPLVSLGSNAHSVNDFGKSVKRVKEFLSL